MFESINPYTGEVVGSYNAHGENEIRQTLGKSHQVFQNWKNVPVGNRSQMFTKLAGLLRSQKTGLATLITKEMGKIIGESEAEIEKCAWLCEYYAKHAGEILEEKGIPTDGTVSYVRFDPLGIIFAIMPWNFPFWQVLRFAVPTIMAGNTVVLKHAPNVFGCALRIEQLFSEAGFPDGVFSNLLIPADLSELVISNHHVQGVTLTGSQRAGIAIASMAGKYLKKTVMELGGSDPFIVLKDADLKLACHTGTASRMLNTGQVCIAAKRFIVESPVHDQFVETHKVLLEKLKSGDPMDRSTNLGPMAREDLVDEIERQVEESIQMGARLVTGGKRLDKQFYAPTLLTDVKKGMPVLDEETFGPVSTFQNAKDSREALQIANDSHFGLGASIWTQDLELAEEMAHNLEVGSVFINGMVKSDPRLPFGGVKQSGYGRELSHFGLLEFTNATSIWMK
jgi:succinate-semialdehyde dehydrogenase/glutarate-semialdehyde dehydrogenase